MCFNTPTNLRVIQFEPCVIFPILSFNTPTNLRVIQCFIEVVYYEHSFNTPTNLRVIQFTALLALAGLPF